MLTSKMSPKWVQNGSKRGPKGGPKMGPPEVGTKKKVEKYFFIWPQSTKKVTHVPVFEDKKLFLRKKIILQGGVVSFLSALGALMT